MAKGIYQHKKGRVAWNKGKKMGPHTEEWKRKVSESHKKSGIIPPNWKGKKRSPESVEKSAAKRRGVKRPQNSCENNKKWKGDDASYYAIHIWISNHFGKAYEFPCSFCEKTGNSHQMHWANIDHKYSRDKKDWIVLCARCHANYDRMFLGIKRGGLNKKT